MRIYFLIPIAGLNLAALHLGAANNGNIIPHPKVTVDENCLEKCKRENEKIILESRKLNLGIKLVLNKCLEICKIRN